MAYRQAAVVGANGLGLLIALFDTMAGNLRRAAAAQREDNIEGRCREVTHALMVIGQLESALNLGSGGELADKLALFYSTARNRLIEAQAKQSVAMLEQEMVTMLALRASWQQVEVSRAMPGPDVLPPATAAAHSMSAPLPTDSRLSGWSA
jgi:Flagellin-specific chaperone FliS